METLWGNDNRQLLDSTRSPGAMDFFDDLESIPNGVSTEAYDMNPRKTRPFLPQFGNQHFSQGEGFSGNTLPRQGLRSHPHFQESQMSSLQTYSDSRAYPAQANPNYPPFHSGVFGKSYDAPIRQFHAPFPYQDLPQRLPQPLQSFGSSSYPLTESQPPQFYSRPSSLVHRSGTPGSQ